jgi:hypothetical protein
MLIRCGLFTKTITPPVITAFTLSNPTKASGCAPIAMDATWVIKDADNASYKLVIQETGVEFSCASTVGPVSVDTADTYLDGSSNSLTPTLTLTVVRRSDSVTMASLAATCSSAILVGSAC